VGALILFTVRIVIDMQRLSMQSSYKKKEKESQPLSEDTTPSGVKKGYLIYSYIRFVYIAKITT
jgi:hypothetical protein